MDHTAPGSPVAPATVILAVEPGHPRRHVTAVRRSIEDRLRERCHREVEVTVREQALGIRPDNTLDLASAGRIDGENDGADAVVVVTEIPRRSEGRPLVAEVVASHRVAVVSLPTLGLVGVRSRLGALLVDLAEDLLGAGADDEGGGRPERPHRSAGGRWGTTRGDAHPVLRAPRGLGGLRTVLGMVAANEPARTAPRLSGALAAAAATGAFGIFYNSIWVMADRLSAARLALVAVLAVVSMVAWLVVRNRLWDRPVRSRLATVVLLYNLSTVVTLTFVITGLYLLLVVLILVAGVIVIDPGFMESVIGHPPGVGGYLDVAWLSAAMGVVAGGLGSGFDSETDLRRLTHGARERQRKYTEEDAGE